MKPAATLELVAMKSRSTLNANSMDAMCMAHANTKTMRWRVFAMQASAVISAMCTLTIVQRLKRLAQTMVPAPTAMMITLVHALAAGVAASARSATVLMPTTEAKTRCRSAQTSPLRSAHRSRHCRRCVRLDATRALRRPPPPPFQPRQQQSAQLLEPPPQHLGCATEFRIHASVGMRHHLW